MAPVRHSFWAMGLACMVSGVTPSVARGYAETPAAKPAASPASAPGVAPDATPDDVGGAVGDASASKRRIWEYALLGTAIAGIATGVTLVTVNHARVKDYNLGVQAYNQGVDANPQTFAQLADLRDSINTGERWGYIIGAVGLVAGLAAGYLYVTDPDGDTDKQGDGDRDDDGPSAKIYIAPGGLVLCGRF